MKAFKIISLCLMLAAAAFSATYKSGKFSILYKIDEASKTLTVMGETEYDLNYYGPVYDE